MKFFSSIGEKVKNNFKTFPATMGLFYLVSVVYLIFGNKFNGFLDDFYSILSITIFGTIFSEVIFKRYRLHKFVCIVGSMIVAIFFNRFLYCFNKEAVMRIIITYCIAMGGFAVFKLYIDSKLDFREFILNIFSKIFYNGIIYLVIVVGCIIICTLFYELFAIKGYSYYALKSIIVPLGIFYIPEILRNMAKVNEITIDKFFRGLVLYLLVPLVYCAIGIMYLYICKILIMRDMPKNIVGRSLIIMFCFVTLVYFLAHKFKNEGIGKFANVLPLVFSPLMLLEIFSIGIRVYEFGVTPLRYFAILFLVLEIIIYALIYIKKGRFLGGALVTVIILTFIFLISDFSYINVCRWSQENVIKKYANGEKVNVLSVQGAYEYLIEDGEGEKFINKTLSKEQIDYLKSDEIVSKWKNRKYLYYTSNDDEVLNIGNYNKLKKIYNKGDEDSKEMKKIIDQLKDYSEEELKEYINKVKVFKIKDNEDFYFTYLNIAFDDNKKIDYYNYSGYLLIK